MAILFIDFENGNNNYGGTSFDLLASGADGRITTATFSSATANFPNDGSLINQYLSIFNGTIYAIYRITAWVNSTSLTIAALSGGTALANQTVDRQYFIGGRWQTLTDGATAVRIIPGDEIRVMASPDPTSLGINGTWTSSPLQPTRSISGSTNATPIVVTCNAHGYANGDTIVITGHTTNTNANGTWEISNVTTNTFTLVNSIGNGVGGATGTARLRNNSVVRLASAVTANIASTGNRGNGRTSWTSADATNVTTTLNTTDYKEGDCSDSVAIGVNFTTGRTAFKSTGVLDLSGYQQVSFFIKQTAGTVTVTGDVSLRLCSDTLGSTTVHTIVIPQLGALNVWQPITVDLATNLSNSIQSIALYVDTDRGAVTFLLSNIIACKAKSSSDSLSLISLVGKNTGTEPWVSIQSINETRVFLDGLVSHLPTTASLMGYYGTSDTVTIYKRETIPIYSTYTPTESGTSESVAFTVSGGWDRVAMSSQNSHTYLDGRRGNISCISWTSNRSFWNFIRLNLYRFSIGLIGAAGSYWKFIDSQNVNHNSTGLEFQGSLFSYGTISEVDNVCFNGIGVALSTTSLCQVYNIKNIDSNSSNGISRNFTGGSFHNIGNITSLCNNGSTAILLQNWSSCSISNIGKIDHNGNQAISISGSSSIIISNIGSISGLPASIAGITYSNPIVLSGSENCQLINISSISGGTSSAISCTSSFNNLFININTSGNVTSAFAGDIGNSYCLNCAFGEAILVTGLTRDGKVFLQNQNNNANNHQIHMFGGLVSSNTSIRNTSSGISWALAPTNSARSSGYPVSISLAKILVFANKLVTIKGMLRRTNTALTIQLVVKGNQIAGVSNDAVAAMTEIANTWQEVTLTLTPTETGVVELVGEAYGGTTHTGYIDDLTITQAT